MKNWVSSILLAILWMGCAENGPQERILPYPIHQDQLENGLKIVTVSYDSPGLASLYIVVRVGSRNEVEPGLSGFAHFFEHMMFRGTEQYPREKYNQVLKSIGASANAYTSNDRTVYHMTGNAEKLALMLEVEADRFRNLKYSQHDFKAEAGAVKGEYTKNYASPYNRLYEKTRANAFDVHTYKHTTMGFFEDIVDMPNQYDYSLEFFNRYYRPEYITVVMVGDVQPKVVNALVENYFGDWEQGSFQAQIPVEPVQQETRYAHLQDGSVPPFIGLNYKGPAFSDTGIDMPALDVLNSILFSRNSDLYQKLVVDEQKARFLSAGAYDSRDPYLITIQASLYDPEDMDYVKAEIQQALEEVKTAGVDPDILTDTKSNLKYSFAMGIDNPGSIANSLSHYISLTGDPESLNRLYSLYDQVSGEDIITVANKYFGANNLTVATISPQAEREVSL